MRRTILHSAVVALIAGVALVAVAPPAFAAITVSVDQGVLAVTGDDERDTIVIGCQDGEVVVSGMEPATGPAVCETITSIVVRSGGERDRIVLEDVRPRSFASLTDVSVDAGDGHDRIFGSRFPETISGGADDDVVTASPTAGDVIDGGQGRDRVDFRFAGHVSVSDTEVVSETGTVPFTSIEWLQLKGSPGDDRLYTSGFSGAIAANGRTGNDRLIGPARRGARPGLNGGPGNDVVIGGVGADVLGGGGGNDMLSGGAGRDYLVGNAGTDRCDGAAGGDYFSQCESVTSKTRLGVVQWDAAQATWTRSFGRLESRVGPRMRAHASATGRRGTTIRGR